MIPNDTGNQERYAGFQIRVYTVQSTGGERNVNEADTFTHDRLWPDIDEKLFDMEVAGAFFGGMEENRRAMMENRPHWSEPLSPSTYTPLTLTLEPIVLEMLAVHETHQRRGIAASLIHWGTQQADANNLETYLDGSAYAKPYYLRHHGFEGPGMNVPIPDR